MNSLEPAKTLSNYGIGVPPTHKVKCPICKDKDAQIFFNPHPMVRTNQAYPCAECKEKRDKITAEERRWYEQSAKGIFVQQKTGEEVVLDQRGRPMENPYKNRHFDNHGWMQTNTKKYTKYLEKNGKL